MSKAKMAKNSSMLILRIKINLNSQRIFKHFASFYWGSQGKPSEDKAPVTDTQHGDGALSLQHWLNLSPGYLITGDTKRLETMCRPIYKWGAEDWVLPHDSDGAGIHIGGRYTHKSIMWLAYGSGNYHAS